jgi:hypothetical protein
MCIWGSTGEGSWGLGLTSRPIRGDASWGDRLLGLQQARGQSNCFGRWRGDKPWDTTDWRGKEEASLFWSWRKQASTPNSPKRSGSQWTIEEGINVKSHCSWMWKDSRYNGLFNSLHHRPTFKNWCFSQEWQANQERVSWRMPTTRLWSRLWSRTAIRM